MTDTNSNVQAAVADANKTADAPVKTEATASVPTPTEEAKVEEKKV